MGSCLGQWPPDGAIDSLHVVHGLRGNQKLPVVDVDELRGQLDQNRRVLSGDPDVQWSSVTCQGVDHTGRPMAQSSREDTTQASHPFLHCHETLSFPILLSTFRRN